MKKGIFLLVSLFVLFQAYGQKDEDEKTKKTGKPLARLEQADRIVVDVFSDVWMNKPLDSYMHVSAINRGANVYYFRDIPIGKSNFSFAAGGGISCHNLYCNAVPVRETNTDPNEPAGYAFSGKTVFSKIPDKIGSEEIEVKNNKLSLVFVDVPFEFRFRTKNEGQKFKISLGFKIGYLLSSHTKYHGSDIVYNYLTRQWEWNSDKKIKIKTYRIPNIETYRMGPTFRIGWGWINISAYYSLTKLFKKAKGQDMYPVSVGISITPF